MTTQEVNRNAAREKQRRKVVLSDAQRTFRRRMNLLLAILGTAPFWCLVAFALRDAPGPVLPPWEVIAGLMR